MENKNIKFITVEQEFHIGGSCTSEIVQRFKKLIDSGIIDTSKAILCNIHYLLMNNNPENGPVNIFFLDGIRVKLNLTAGYTGTGPRDTCQVLKLCEFEFDESDILTHQEVVDIKYYKDIDEDTVYQFTNFDGSHVYSNL